MALPQRQASPVWPLRLHQWGWVVALLGLTFWLHGTPVPYDNESLYLVSAYKAWHPDFLAADWMLGTIRREHLVFNLVAGLPMVWLGIEAVGWIGRLAGWTAILVGLIRLGTHFRIPPWMAAAAVALWLLTGQSLFGGEWLIEGFEAKVVAYPLLLFALDAFLSGRDRKGAILLGLCFSFHASVGLGAAFATLVALVGLRQPLGVLRRIAGWFAVGALPGSVALMSLTTDSLAAGREVWRFITVVALPMHLDPLWYGRSAVVLLVLMLSFVTWRSLRRSDDVTHQFTLWFLVGLTVVALGGVGARAAGWYELLQVFPFRLLPVFTPIFFFLHLAYAYHHSNGGRLELPAAVCAVGALLLSNPLPTVDRMLGRRVRSWDTPKDAEHQALRWIRDHTELEATVITSPLLRDSFYWSQRPHLATLHDPQVGRLAEWMARIEAQLGGSVPFRALSSGEVERRYAQLTPTQIEDIASRFGGDLLLTTTAYPYEQLFVVEDVKVYRVPAQRVE